LVYKRRYSNVDRKSEKKDGKSACFFSDIMKPRKIKLFGGDGMEKVAGLSEEKLKKIVEFLRERCKENIRFWIESKGRC